MTCRSAVAASLLAVSMSSAATAATVTTQQFIATVQPLLDYLDASSRAAGERTTSARVRGFADTEAREAASMRNAIAIWRTADARQAAEDAAAPTIDGLGPLANAINVTVDAAAGANRALAAPLAPLASQSDLEGFGQRDLTRLAALTGADLDAFYVASDKVALGHLVDALRSYIMNGDDEGLRRFAVHNLPRAERRLAAIRRL